MPPAAGRQPLHLICAAALAGSRRRAGRRSGRRHSGRRGSGLTSGPADRHLPRFAGRLRGGAVVLVVAAGRKGLSEHQAGGCRRIAGRRPRQGAGGALSAKKIRGASRPLRLVSAGVLRSAVVAPVRWRRGRCDAGLRGLDGAVGRPRPRFRAGQRLEQGALRGGPACGPQPRSGARQKFSYSRQYGP